MASQTYCIELSATDKLMLVLIGVVCAVLVIIAARLYSAQSDLVPERTWRESSRGNVQASNTATVSLSSRHKGGEDELRRRRRAAASDFPDEEFIFPTVDVPGRRQRSTDSAA
ncbi:hypothetical protein F4861DRAFT_543956 [Xylaria intraflava]|nr:hypothetical protein F4861DRAFT_543956 [Xylaria intraflava]